MKKIIQKILKFFGVGAAVVAMAAFFAPAQAQAAPNLTVSYLSASDSDSSWGESSSANAGENVYFYLELHNTNVPSTAKNAKIKVSGFDSSNVTNFSSTATYSADNASAVSDVTTVAFNKAVDISYVPGSVYMTWDVDGDGNYEYNGTQVSDSIFHGGLVLGDQEGCNPYVIQLSFTAKTKQHHHPDEEIRLTLEKKVSYGSDRDHGTWYEAISRDKKKFGPGDYLYYRIIVKNIGDVTVEEITLEDQLPSYLYWNGGDGHYKSGPNIVKYNIGDLAKGAKSVVEYQLRVKDTLPNGERTQENVVIARSTNYQDLQDSTVVWIKGPDEIEHKREEVEIVTTRVERVEKEIIEVLPETGGNFLIPNLVISLGSLVIGLGLKKLEN